MDEKIVIRPSRYRQFGDPEGATFCFVTNGDLIDRFHVEMDGHYPDYKIIAFDRDNSFPELLRTEIPEPAHVFVISPNRLFRSPYDEELGPRRKLIVMACNSTPTPLDAVAHFLGIIEKNDPQVQEDWAQRFFELGEQTEYMEFVDQEYGTRAVFEHLNDRYEWNQQAGYVGWGEQQLAPMGEISVLPADVFDFSHKLSLALNGEITFKGLPILHAGQPSFLREDQARIYRRLYGMMNHAVVATVKNGVVTALRPTDEGSRDVARMFETMFDVDSRWRYVWELGFAINTDLVMYGDNNAMNEVYGGTNGALHYGLGLTPYTQYHMDLVCPGTKILGSKGQLLFGGTPAEAAAA